MKRVVLLSITLTVCAGLAHGQYLKELKDLKQKDPAAWNRMRALDILQAQEILATFGYGTLFTATLDERTAEALRKYQARNGLPVTGDVDDATLRSLNENKLELQRDVPLAPRYSFGDFPSTGFVTVTGVRLQQGKEPGANTPLLPARVECLKDIGECIVATLQSEGSENIHLNYYEVQKWDRYEIIAVCDLPCGRETIHIDRPGKTLLVINMGTYENLKACTQLFGPPGGTTVIRLGDSEKITNARWDALRAAESHIKLMSSDAERLMRP
jgi:hypothetical protein